MLKYQVKKSPTVLNGSKKTSLNVGEIIVKWRRQTRRLSNRHACFPTEKILYCAAVETAVITATKQR